MKELLEKLAKTLDLEADKLAEALGVEDADSVEDLDEDKLAEAIASVVKDRDEAKTEAQEAKDKLEDLDEDGKSLEERAKDQGKIVVDADTFKGLTDRVSDTEKALADKDFTEHFDAALNDPDGPRVDAKPETRENYRKLYDQDREATITLLDSLQPIVKGKPDGSGGNDEEAPDGVDEESWEIDRKVKARMKDKDEDYPTALAAITAEIEAEAELV